MTARLDVDLEKIRANTESVVGLLARRGLDLVAVTKACLGQPEVAGAMLSGGAVALADTREANLLRLRQAFPEVELHSIYLPSLREASSPADLSYVTSLPAARAAAESAGRPRQIMILVETGDRREGLLAGALLELARDIVADPKLDLAGIATNYACFAGSAEGLAASVAELAIAVRDLRAAGLEVRRVSGGNSSLLPLLSSGPLPTEITELRCGEALLLGVDALRHDPIPGCLPDACVLRGEVLERYTGRTGEGAAARLLVGIGAQDLGAAPLRFVRPGLRELGRSSDYLVVGADSTGRSVPPGEFLEMIPTYYALVAAWTSPFVEVHYV